jgi:hypothetical protein
MIKKLFMLAIAGLCVFSLGVSFAQSEEQEPLDRMKVLKEEFSQAKNEYIRAKREVRRAAMENFLSFGKTEEEKKERKIVLEQAKQKQARLRETYKKAKKALKKQRREVYRAEYKKFEDKREENQRKKRKLWEKKQLKRAPKKGPGNGGGKK